MSVLKSAGFAEGSDILVARQHRTLLKLSLCILVIASLTSFFAVSVYVRRSMPLTDTRHPR